MSTRQITAVEITCDSCGKNWIVAQKPTMRFQVGPYEDVDLCDRCYDQYHLSGDLVALEARIAMRRVAG